MEDLVWDLDDDVQHGRQPSTPARDVKAQKFKGFLELFSGSGRLAEAIRAARLSWIEAWDITHGPHHDLSNPALLAQLLRRIRMGVFLHIHLGPPCATYSIARLPRSRTRQHVLGLPGLQEPQATMVAEGTFFAMLTVEIATVCLEKGIGFTIEQPLTSLMWELPAMQALLANVMVFSFVFHCCRYGKQWLKPT